jgi:hypothetical protein
MSIFFVVHWWVWVAVLAFGALLGLLSATLLSGRKPGWTPRARITTAALLAPVIIATGTIVGALLAAAGIDADHWGYLAAASLLQIGMVAVPLAFLGGLAAAWFADRALRE